MHYLICDECKIYYRIDSDFDLDTLKTYEKCSSGLEYYENFED